MLLLIVAAFPLPIYVPHQITNYIGARYTQDIDLQFIVIYSPDKTAQDDL